LHVRFTYALNYYLLASCLGFGEVGLESSFWLGLKCLHQLTRYGGYTRMRVEMQADDDNAWYSAEYDHFSVANESTEYRLSVAGYSGDAETDDQLWPSHWQNFSTYDHGMQASMAVMMEGGWWYSGFDFACLNGVYESSFMMNSTGFYWNSNYQIPLPPRTSGLFGAQPGRLRSSRIMLTRP